MYFKKICKNEQEKLFRKTTGDKDMSREEVSDTGSLFKLLYSQGLEVAITILLLVFQI